MNAAAQVAGIPDPASIDQAITGRRELLELQPVLAQSIRLRNPYVDPLHYLQIRYLRLWRNATEQERTEQLRRLLAITVKGVAAGMKSTG